MEAISCPSYPHYTWLAHRVALEPPRIFDVHECRHVTHHLMLTVAGAADIRWMTRQAEAAFHTAVGCIGYFPCVREVHTLSITSPDGFRAYDLLIPDHHIRRCCASEGMSISPDLPATPAFRDALTEASLLRLSMKAECGQVSEDIGDEIAARQIMLQLCGIIGASRPDWLSDTSVFLPAVMRQIVAHIDATLSAHPSLGTIADTVGMSPGHFARKFKRSAGLSLGRFMNKRRIGMAFAMLRDGEAPLVRIAIDLGFSSQSHFTRLFSSHTGMTPQYFRRQHVRMDR